MPVFAFLSANILAITEFVSLIVAGLLAGIAAVIGIGFKDRFFSEQGTDRKQSRGRKTPAESTELEERQKVAHYTKKLRVGEVDDYLFKIHKGDRVTGKISSNGTFSAYFVTESSQRSFYNGYEFNDIEGVEDAFDYEPNFEAPRTGTFYLIIVNDDKKNIKIQVELNVIHV